VFLGKWLLLAYLLQALLIAYVPAELVATVIGGDGVGPILLATIVGAPAYLNGYAAIPLLEGLIGQGMNPGAAMAFVIAGGISSIPAAVAVWALVKPRVFAAYIAFALIGAFAAGLAWSVDRLTGCGGVAPWPVPPLPRPSSRVAWRGSNRARVPPRSAERSHLSRRSFADGAPEAALARPPGQNKHTHLTISDHKTAPLGMYHRQVWIRRKTGHTARPRVGGKQEATRRACWNSPKYRNRSGPESAAR
jgi:hypothetical protein